MQEKAPRQQQIEHLIQGMRAAITVGQEAGKRSGFFRGVKPSIRSFLEPEFYSEFAGSAVRITPEQQKGLLEKVDTARRIVLTKGRKGSDDAQTRAAIATGAFTQEQADMLRLLDSSSLVAQALERGEGHDTFLELLYPQSRLGIQVAEEDTNIRIAFGFHDNFAFEIDFYTQSQSRRARTQKYVNPHDAVGTMNEREHTIIDYYLDRLIEEQTQPNQ